MFSSGRGRIRVGSTGSAWRAKAAQTSGFTLIEVIAALVLLGLLSAILGMGLVAALRSHEFSRTNVHLGQKAQLAMMRLSREILELTEIEAISASGQDTFIIYRRIDPTQNQPNERYGLHFDSSTRRLLLYTALNPAITALNSGTAVNGDVLIDNVDSFTLNYFQGVNTWTWGSDPDLLSAIRINLQIGRPDAPGRTQGFQTLIHLRNTGNYGGAAPAAAPVSRYDYSCFISVASAIP